MARPPGTTLRAIRINDELWKSVQSKAEAEGRTVSDVIRDYLKRWVAQPPRKLTYAWGGPLTTENPPSGPGRSTS